MNDVSMLPIATYDNLIAHELANVFDMIAGIHTNYPRTLRSRLGGGCDARMVNADGGR